MSGSEEKISPELQQFLLNEQAKAQMQQTVARLTDTCWDKCVGTPGRSLSSREEACLSDCAKRFIETTQVQLISWLLWALQHQWQYISLSWYSSALHSTCCVRSKPAVRTYLGTVSEL